MSVLTKISEDCFQQLVPSVLLSNKAVLKGKCICKCPVSV